MDYRALIAKYFPANQVDNAFRVMMGESSGDPRAHATQGEDSRGLFQLNVAQGANPQLAEYNLYDPETNIRLAAQMYGERGWQPWTAAQKLGLVSEPRQQENAIMAERGVKEDVTVYVDQDGNPVDGPDRGLLGTGAFAKNVTKVRKVIYANGEIHVSINDGPLSYVKTDPQLAAGARAEDKTPTFRDDPSGLQMWDEEKRRLVPAPGATPKRPIPIADTKSRFLDGLDEQGDRVPNPDYNAETYEEQDIVTGARYLTDKNTGNRIKQTGPDLRPYGWESGRGMAPRPPQAPQRAPLYPWEEEAGRLGVDKTRLDMEKTRHDLEKGDWWKQQELDQKVKEMDQQRENQRLQAEASIFGHLTDWWSKSLPYAVRPGQTHPVGFESGGPYERLVQMGGGKYDAGQYQMPVYPFDPFTPWNQTKQITKGG